MKKFAVDYNDGFSGKLNIEIIEAENWKEALGKHSAGIFEDGFELPDDLEEAKKEAYNSGMLIDVKEIV